MDTKWLLGVLTTISITLSSFALKWMFDANADKAQMKLQIAALQNAMAQRDRDDGQDRQLRLLWQAEKWVQDQINVLRYKAKLEPVAGPEFK